MSVATTRPAIGSRVADAAALARMTVDSPVGVLTIVATVVGVREVLFDGPVEPERPENDAGAMAVAQAAARQLAEYFAGRRREFDVPLDPLGTAFQLRAWTVLRDIPYGQTRSYLDQARAIGNERACRAVGAANGRNPIAIIVPCHRVIGAGGALVGYGGGMERKRWLLEFERRMEPPARAGALLF